MKNLLFTGNPATGKTFLARAAAYYLCYEKLNIDSFERFATAYLYSQQCLQG